MQERTSMLSTRLRLLLVAVTVFAASLSAGTPRAEACGWGYCGWGHCGWGWGRYAAYDGCTPYYAWRPAPVRGAIVTVANAVRCYQVNSILHSPGTDDIGNKFFPTASREVGRQG